MRPVIGMHGSRLLALLGAVLVAAACGPAGETDSLAESKGINAGVQPLAADNGLSLNGLNRNGLSLNGLSQNGLSLNGLNLNGLSTSAFSNWFNGDAATSASVMWYLYGCAAPAGSTLTWKNPATGITYFWVGVFGLAPGWTSGKPATVAEQQVITACLAAHVNKFGVHVPIAVEGRTAKGVQIPILTGELSTFSVREGCFFGNLFNGEGIFVGADHSPWSKVYSSARACGFDTAASSGFDTSCSPLQTTGVECRRFCTSDSTGTFYETCAWNGKAYQPITTRLLPAEVYKCGDGVCQFTEHCGTGKSSDSCLADCGPCP
jgi:hypothetical protein